MLSRSIRCLCICLLMMALVPSFLHARDRDTERDRGGSSSSTWTPASPTTEGGKRPIYYVEALGGYQDTSGVTPAAADSDVLGRPTNLGTGSSGVSQTTTLNKPLLKLKVKNDQPAIEFDGSNDRYKGSYTVPTTITQPGTMILVAKLDPSKVDDKQQVTLTNGIDNNTRWQFGKGNFGGVSDYWSFYAGSSVTWFQTDDSDWHIWTIRVNGANTRIWDNGTSRFWGNAGSLNLDHLVLGAFNNGGYNWKGYLGGAVLYSGELSAADMNQVGKHWGDQFAISRIDIF